MAIELFSNAFFQENKIEIFTVISGNFILSAQYIGLHNFTVSINLMQPHLISYCCEIQLKKEVACYKLEDNYGASHYRKKN